MGAPPLPPVAGCWGGGVVADVCSFGAVAVGALGLAVCAGAAVVVGGAVAEVPWVLGVEDGGAWAVVVVALAGAGAGAGAEAGEFEGPGFASGLVCCAVLGFRHCVRGYVAPWGLTDGAIADSVTAGNSSRQVGGIRGSSGPRQSRRCASRFRPRPSRAPPGGVCKRVRHVGLSDRCVCARSATPRARHHARPVTPIAGRASFLRGQEKARQTGRLAGCARSSG